MSTLNREGGVDGVGGSANTPLTATAPMPTSSMKIYVSETSSDSSVAENVKIGDKLSLSINIEEQGKFNQNFY